MSNYNDARNRALAATKEELEKLVLERLEKGASKMAKISDFDRLMKEMYIKRDENLIKIQQEATDSRVQDRSHMTDHERIKMLEKEVADLKELLNFSSIEELLDICEEDEDDGVV
jgi:t-SNARE complex subunit (syntaxin)